MKPEGSLPHSQEPATRPYVTNSVDISDDYLVLCKYYILKHLNAIFKIYT
jgi:hypothetical protein